MAKKDIGGNWTRESRNAINSNFDELYAEYLGAGNSATDAKRLAIEAVAQAESTQAQLDQIVIDGDSSVEAAAARVAKDGETYATLKARLDSENTEVTEKLDDIEDMQNYEVNSKSRDISGFTVFTTDDGANGDYIVGKQLSVTENIPFTFYLVPTWLDSPGFMSTEQALELQNNFNWEAGSHSRTHPSSPVMKDNPNNTFVEREFWESKRDLIEKGFDIQSYAYPGGNYGLRERKLAKKYYRSARCSDVSSTRGVNYSPLNSQEMKTVWLDPVVRPFKTHLEDNDRSTALQIMLDYFKVAIDRASDNKGILVISTHFDNIDSEDLKQLYRDVIQYAKTKTEVTTMQGALNKMGNIVEVGDYSQYEYKAPTDTHFVIGADGLSSGTASVAKKGRFTLETPFEDFPFGVVYVPIYKSDSSNAPGELAGTLINYKIVGEDYGFNFQEYILFGAGLVYRRGLMSNGKFSEFKSDIKRIFTANENEHTHITPFDEFEAGLTYSIVRGDDVDLASAPEKKSGTLSTHRVSPGSSRLGYNYQEYLIEGTDTIYRRRVSPDLTFYNWRKVTGNVMPYDNEFTTNSPFKDFSEGKTYSIIQGNNPAVSDAPGGLNGTLETTKLTNTGLLGYSYQVYKAFNNTNRLEWKRFPESSTSWGTWKVITRAEQ